MELSVQNGDGNYQPGTSSPFRPQSDKDWDERRATIEDLYCNQDLDLRKVIAIMKEQNFIATSVLKIYVALSPTD